MEKEFSCTSCGVLQCVFRNKQQPQNCIAKDAENQQVCQESIKIGIEDADTARILKAAAQVESTHFGQLTRVEEIVLFAKKIGAKKIGIASCTGLILENQVFAKVLSANKLEPYGIVCKAGSIDKCEFGLDEQDKICPGRKESGCNPIMQAKLCNKAKTDLNVISGLCVGHDTLFIRYSDAPVTYLLVKDRVLAHNPVAALYASKSYYSRILYGLDV